MSNYPDNFSSSAFDAAYGSDGREYPTWAEIKAIAQKHLEPAFKAMAAEINKAGPRGHSALDDAAVSKMLEYTINDELVEGMGDEFVAAVNEGL